MPRSEQIITKYEETKFIIIHHNQKDTNNHISKLDDNWSHPGHYLVDP